MRIAGASAALLGIERDPIQMLRKSHPTGWLRLSQVLPRRANPVKCSARPAASGALAPLQRPRRSHAEPAVVRQQRLPPAPVARLSAAAQ